jgi:hypothetical protein
MEKEEKPLCPICKRPMVWVKDTLLCLVCHRDVIWELLTPSTIEEQNKWIDNNRGGV